jgi:hypothetical protein
MTRGVVRVTQGPEVKAKVIGAARGMEGEAGVIMAARGVGEIVRVVGQASEPSPSAMRVVGPLGGAVRLLASATRAVRLPQGPISPPAVVVRVLALSHVPMGESIRSISNKNS